jgi:hypothetical protein
MGHANPPADWFEKAIVFLDSNIPQKRTLASMRTPSRTTAASQVSEPEVEREIRTWTSKSGATIDAALQKEIGSFVILKKANGKNAKISVYNLCKEDRIYLHKLKKSSAQKTFY